MDRLEKAMKDFAAARAAAVAQRQEEEGALSSIEEALKGFQARIQGTRAAVAPVGDAAKISWHGSTVNRDSIKRTVYLFFRPNLPSYIEGDEASWPFISFALNWEPRPRKHTRETLAHDDTGVVSSTSPDWPFQLRGRIKMRTGSNPAEDAGEFGTDNLESTILEAAEMFVVKSLRFLSSDLESPHSEAFKSLPG